MHKFCEGGVRQSLGLRGVMHDHTMYIVQSLTDSASSPRSLEDSQPHQNGRGRARQG